MTQVGEGIVAELIKLLSDEYLFVAVSSVTFDSGIKIFDVKAGGAEEELPSPGTPHWSPTETYPAVYVREGGTGETKDVKVKVEWSQAGYDGSAKLKGESSDGTTVIEGDFTISGDTGSAEVSCTFTKKPTVVADYSKGMVFEWTVSAGGDDETAPGGSPLKLFFVDAKPKPIGWGYKAHYLRVIEWATSWAQGKAGEKAVFAALWDQFSDGTGARSSHATGYSYWKTNKPVQDLKTLIAPDGGAKDKGWSCRAIAHLFMECLAIHGIQCLEVIPNTAPGTRMFLVHNWDVSPSPTPNWEASPDLYFAGSWVPSDSPPLNTDVSSSLKKQKAGGPSPEDVEIDMAKRPGVPAQGQRRAPLGFSNHWIVQVAGSIYDTSYGLRHANDMTAYSKTSLAGWLIDVVKDTYSGGFLWLTTKTSSAWRTREISKHSILRYDGDSN